MIRCGLSSWTIESRTEPIIRVGIVLPEDAMDTLLISIPEETFIVSADSGPGQPVRGVAAKVAIESDQIVFLSESEVVGPADVLVIAPEEEAPLSRGSGIKLRGVVTGRGFHWQKRMHPTLCGLLEIRVWEGCLLVVNELPFEDYLPGVLAGEMGSECPIEFLKSQCLVARSWALAHSERKHPDLPIDRCNDDCCQRYHGTTDLTPTVIDAVRSTGGQALVNHAGQIVDANYSKSCGGISESPEHVWSVRKPGLRPVLDAPLDSLAASFFPLSTECLEEYLTGKWVDTTDVFCSPNVVPVADLKRYLGTVDEGTDYFRWKIDYERADLEQVLRQKFFARQDPSRIASLATLTNLESIQRGDSGRIIELEITYLDPMGAQHKARVSSEYKIRDVLHQKFLYSSAFLIRIERNEGGLPTRISLLGGGWGHGAGLCQIGALGMALKGYDHGAIVRHYFDEAELQSCY